MEWVVGLQELQPALKNELHICLILCVHKYLKYQLTNVFSSSTPLPHFCKISVTTPVHTCIRTLFSVLVMVA